MKMKKVLIALFAISLVPNISFAGPKAEVLHWWTSGGEAKALSVLKADFAAKGGVWTDMPVAGGGGDAAMQTLKARIVAGDSPAAAQVKGPSIQEYDDQGVIKPYNIDSVAKAEGWDNLVSKQVAQHMKCNNFTQYCAAPVNIHRIDWFWANKSVLDSNGIKMPTTWKQFNAAADKLQAAGIIPFAHGGQPWQDATVFEAVALGIGGNDFYKKAFIDLDQAALSGSTMVKIFDQMRKLKSYTDAGSPGRDWNVATGTPSTKNNSRPSNHGYLDNVDSFVFYNVKGADKVEGQKLLASLIMGKNFQKVFNMYKGSIPARLDVSMDDFDDCAKKSNSDLNAASKAGGLMPSYAHGMALKGAQSGAITDVVTQHFNSNMSSKDAAMKLAAAVKASL